MNNIEPDYNDLDSFWIDFKVKDTLGGDNGELLSDFLSELFKDEDEESEYLKKAKEIFSDSNTSEETREAIKEIFPDLEISAIEKVRLALIRLVKDQNPEDIQNKYGISKDEAIIWLDYKRKKRSLLLLGLHLF